MVRITVSWAAASSGVQALETLSASRAAGMSWLGAGVRVTSEEKSLGQPPSLRPGVRVRVRDAYPVNLDGLSHVTRCPSTTPAS